MGGLSNLNNGIEARSVFLPRGGGLRRRGRGARAAGAGDLQQVSERYSQLVLG